MNAGAHHAGVSFSVFSVSSAMRYAAVLRAVNLGPHGKISMAALRELAAKIGFELVNVGVEEMDAFMKEKIKLYTEGAGRLGLGKK